MRKSYPWIEGWELPEWVLEARYDTGAGEAIFVVAEVDEALQHEGWPAFCLASLDLGCGKMICRSTASDISGYVVRWLPVDVSFKQ